MASTRLARQLQGRLTGPPRRRRLPHRRLTSSSATLSTSPTLVTMSQIVFSRSSMILLHQTMKCVLHMMEEDASIVVAITYEAIFFALFDCS
jgi:hypothetical protein